MISLCCEILSLSKRSKEIRVYILSLGIRSENFMCMEFYEPHIKPDKRFVKVSHVFIPPLISADNYTSCIGQF